MPDMNHLTFYLKKLGVVVVISLYASLNEQKNPQNNTKIWKSLIFKSNWNF